MNETAMALMCAGLAPIHPTPFSIREGEPSPKPAPRAKKAPDFSRLDAFRARREAALQARVNRVHALLLQRGPLSRAQIAAELRTNGDTTLDHLGILRGRGLVEVKKINRVPYYRAVQK